MKGKGAGGQGARAAEFDVEDGSSTGREHGADRYVPPPERNGKPPHSISYHLMSARLVSMLVKVGFSNRLCLDSTDSLQHFVPVSCGFGWRAHHRIIGQAFRGRIFERLIGRCPWTLRFHDRQCGYPRVSYEPLSIPTPVPQKAVALSSRSCPVLPDILLR